MPPKKTSLQAQLKNSYQTALVTRKTNFENVLVKAEKPIQASMSQFKQVYDMPIKLGVGNWRD